MTRRLPLALLGALFGGGEPLDSGAVEALQPPGPAPTVEAPAPALRRLTYAQYHNSARDLFGDADGLLVMPTSLEPDLAIDGLLSVGASETTISPLGVEQYEEAAFSLAEQALAAPSLRDALVPCEPAGSVDDDCAQQALEPFAARAWRRPVTDDELARLLDVAAAAGDTLGDFDAGLTFGLAYALQSPSFLYRQEIGDGERLDDYELATRLSFLFWDTTPDDALLAAAASGALSEDEGLAEQVERLLADERARAGLRTFFTDMMRLYELDALNKDPLVFPHMSPEVGPAAREETLMGLERLIFELDGDYRDIVTTCDTFIDRRLAAIYNVAAPQEEGLGMTTLEPSGGRRGLLGQVSVLALNAHPVSSSATLRGKFVREVLLCQDVPLPPSDVDTSIPEPSDDAPTLRDRVAEHLENETCAACHQFTDPIGLGLENFDGIGRWRDTENDVTIDASGELDGVWFDDAWGLADAVHDHPAFGPCLSETLLRYALGHNVADGEEDIAGWHADAFAYGGYSVQSLLREIAASPALRAVGSTDDDEEAR